jgi:molybdenum cofactor synthesis domain-containing protein
VSGRGDTLLSLEDALRRMLAGVVPLPATECPVSGVHGSVLARDITARYTLPPWDDSAMDGYAVRSADVAGASAARPVRLRVIGEVAAGHGATDQVVPGTSVRVLTGAMLPPGADAVVRVEDTDAAAGVAVLPDSVGIRVAVSPGTSVRAAGSDVRAGDLVLAAGSVMAPHRIGVLVAAGHGAAQVHPRPRVAILSTGDELVPAGEPISGAQIPDSSSAALAAQVTDAGGEAISLGIARDDRQDIIERLRRGVEGADIVVASGGVSVGAHDEVRLAFEDIGRIDLWRVAVQPGKPLAFGRCVASDGRPVLLFGLPGNPVSSFVTFELFVRPVIRRMAGHTDPGGRTIVRARLADQARTDPGRRAFLRVRLGADGQGRPVATLAGGQGSHMLSGLAAADGLAIVPEGVGNVDAGAEVDVIRLDPGSSRSHMDQA